MNRILVIAALFCASVGAQAQTRVVVQNGSSVVSSSNRFPVDATITGGGDATAANQVLQIAQETAFNTALGAMADAACATDNGTCSTIALIKRTNQRLTTINATLGSPMQTTGGTVGLVAGSAIVGRVGIDQTTPGTTNLVAAGQNGTWTVQPGNTPNTTPWLTTGTPSSASGAATTSASSTSAASSLVLKASAGNLYDLTITIGATTGYAMLFDATSLPSNGAVTPVLCYPVISNGTLGGASMSFNPPKRFATGITAGFSTTGCFTLTASATGNFFGGYQ